jgi:hypothetical protein
MRRRKNLTLREAGMTCFRDFNIPLWEVFGGNLLMLIAIVFYITWWTVSFRPNGSEKSAEAAFFITATLFAGLAAVALLCHAIYSLSGTGKGFQVMIPLAGAAVFYIVLLVVTRTGFQREVTAELILITIWAALEGSVIAVLYSSGRFGMAQVVILAILVALATAVGLVCYVLHYRLEEPIRFWNGLVPLIGDGIVAAVFLALLAIS